MVGVKTSHLKGSNSNLICKTLRLDLIIRPWCWRIKFKKQTFYTIDHKWTEYGIWFIFLRLLWAAGLKHKYYQSRQERSDVLRMLDTGTLELPQLYTECQ